MDLLTIELEDLIEILPKEVWAEYKESILRVSSIESTVDGDKAMYFSKAYMLFRRSKKHRGLKMVKKGMANWKLVLDLTQFIDQAFCVENGVDFEEGVMDFLTIGWDLGCLSLRDFLYKSENIAKDADLRAEISLDKNKSLTENLMEAYYEEGITRVGSIKFKLRVPKNTVFFVRVAKELADKHLTVHTFIREFFDEWNWLGGWPQPRLLMSDHTISLIKRITSELNIEKPEIKGIYVKVVKNGNSRD